MAAKDDKITIYDESIDKEHVIETVKKYTEAAGNHELMKKFVHEFLGELYTGRVSIKEPSKKKKKKKEDAGEIALLKFTAVKGIYGHLIEKGISPEDEKTFVAELFRQIVIFDMAKMIKRNIEGEGRIVTLEQDVQELRSRVTLLEKANSSNEWLLKIVASTLIDLKQGVETMKGTLSKKLSFRN